MAARPLARMRAQRPDAVADLPRGEIAFASAAARLIDNGMAADAALGRSRPLRALPEAADAETRAAEVMEFRPHYSDWLDRDPWFRPLPEPPADGDGFDERGAKGTATRENPASFARSFEDWFFRTGDAGLSRELAFQDLRMDGADAEDGPDDGPSDGPGPDDPDRTPHPGVCPDVHRPGWTCDGTGRWRPKTPKDVVDARRDDAMGTTAEGARRLPFGDQSMEGYHGGEGEEEQGGGDDDGADDESGADDGDEDSGGGDDPDDAPDNGDEDGGGGDGEGGSAPEPEGPSAPPDSPPAPGARGEPPPIPDYRRDVFANPNLNPPGTWQDFHDALGNLGEIGPDEAFAYQTIFGAEGGVRRVRFAAANGSPWLTMPIPSRAMTGNHRPIARSVIPETRSRARTILRNDASSSLP